MVITCVGSRRRGWTLYIVNVGIKIKMGISPGLTDTVQRTTHIHLVPTEMQFSKPWSDESLEVYPKKAVHSIHEMNENKKTVLKKHTL